MIDYNPNLPLFSIHIPKCSGTSVLEILQSWFGWWKFYRHYPQFKKNKPPKLARLHSFFSKTDYRKGICVHGHFNRNRRIGIMDYYPDDARQFITVLRDPLSLMISDYFYNLTRIQMGIHYREGKKIESWPYESLDDFLMKNKCYMLQYFPWEMTKDNYRQLIDTHFVHIGVTEKLQESMDIFAKKLYKKPKTVRVRNKTPRSSQASEEAIHVFKENNALEYEIYEYALQLNHY